MTLFEFIMDEEGIQRISLVDRPAIGVEFVTLSAQPIQFKETKKGELIGAVLIPNKPIYREDEERGGYYGYFSKETVAMLSERYMELKNQDKWNIDHTEQEVDGVVVLESWLVEQPDKSQKYGFDLPDGTWMMRVKVKNEDVRREVLETGRLRGFSIEGRFSLASVQRQLQKVVEEKMAAILCRKVVARLKK